MLSKIAGYLRKLKLKNDFRNELVKKFHLSPIKKLNLGAGARSVGFKDGWLNTDFFVLDVTSLDSWKKSFIENTIDNMMAEHVWEHLTEDDGKLAISLCYRFLKPGGVLRIAVPDGFNPSDDYIEHVRINGSGPGADDHKVLYNFKMLKQIFEEIGFRVELKEYWNDQKEFIYNEWTNEKGHIMRSKRYDQRNQNGKLNYTSLIIDGIK